MGVRVTPAPDPC